MTIASAGGVRTHGVGTRQDLPIPEWLALYGAAAAIFISFAALTVLWRRPILDEPNAGHPLPLGTQAVLDSPAIRRAAQAITLAIALFVTVAGVIGPPFPEENVAPWALYVTFWVGLVLVLVSLLFGPVWRVLNPLRLIHALLRPLAGPPLATAERLEGLGYWPAATSLAAFVWLELVYPDRAQPGVVGVFLVLYAVANLLAALWFGERWFARGDGFEVYSALIGRLAPLGRRADGRIAWRNPLKNSATLRPAPGLAAVVIVLVGSTAFDGLTRTEFWTQGPGAANDTVSGTLGLAAMIALTAALYLIGTWGTAALSKADVRDAPGAYAHTVVPIAVGYAIAHYFSLLLIDGQFTWILASDPFGTGLNLFGAADSAVDYTIISSDTIAYVQVGSIVVGHILGVLLAHDRALREDPQVTSTQQLPLLFVMIAYSVFGLGLLFGFGA